jgi:hypothetical protein
MGVYSDLIAGADSIDTGGSDDIRVGIDKAVVRELNTLSAIQGDPGYPTGFDVEDEVQSLAVYVGTVSGGDFTLEFTLANGETFTTAAIAFNANAATIEGAIDTAATAASITGWTNGDISVSGGDLNTAAVVFTFDGVSVAGANHDLIVVDDAGLTGGGTAGAVSVTNEGQTTRPALAVLFLTSAISGTVPAQGEDPTDFVKAGIPGSAVYPSHTLIRALAKEAAIEDGNEALETAILEAFGL